MEWSKSHYKYSEARLALSRLCQLAKVLHISYTMYTRGLPDICTLSPRALGVYIRQTTRAHGISNTCTNEQF